jgi:hypothetical protein
VIIKIVFILNAEETKFNQFSKIIELFTQNRVNKLSKIMGLGSRIQKKTYSGSRIQGSKWHRILDLDPQHWII